ncbi:hypothetical protein D3C80_2160800 [compost metagenome]
MLVINGLKTPLNPRLDQNVRSYWPDNNKSCAYLQAALVLSPDIHALIHRLLRFVLYLVILLLL